MRRVGLTPWVVMFVAGCTAATPPTPTEPTPAPVATLVATAPVSLPAEEVSIEGAAGLTLSGTWRPASSPASPAVLLLHMYRGAREDWAPEVEGIQQAGIASLALDLRGHGDTGGEVDWTLAIEDVAAAHAWMANQPNVDAQRRGTVGASIGANLALTHAAQDTQIRVVALLSPGMDYFGVSLEGLMPAYGGRPILLAASDKDAYSADAVQLLAADALGPADVITYPGSAHGTELLYRTQGDFLGALLNFLQVNLAGQARGNSPPAVR